VEMPVILGISFVGATSLFSLNDILKKSNDFNLYIPLCGSNSPKQKTHP
jgi:hypothetical protein